MTPVKLAFLVGVSDYGESAKNLEFCEKDIERLAEVLDRKGFRCEKWVNKPLPEILKQGVLPNFLATAVHATDTVIFYFSGHGEDLGGEQLLLGKGVKRANMQRALFEDDVLPLSRVLELLAGIAAQKIVIVDACRIPSADQTPAPDLYKERAQTMQSLRNCAVVFASADGEKSFGTPDNTHSRFTHSLTEELKQYGRGLLSIVEATISRVSQYNDGKSQTPWVYASLQERALDGFEIAESQLDRRHWPRHLCGDPVHGVWSTLSGSNALAKYQSGAWVLKARLPESLLDGLISFDCRPSGMEYVFVRAWRKGLAIARVGLADKWHASTVSIESIGARSIERYFGALWSPAGDRLLAFGAPIQGKAGIKCWNLADPNKKKSEDVEGIPIDVDCNAVAWISDYQAIASFCQGESSRSHIHLLETEGRKWTGSYLCTTLHPMRITAITVRKDKLHVYFGCDNGSVAVIDLQNPVQPVFVARQHSSSGLNYLGPVPWTVPSTTGDDLSQLGVTYMAYDEHTGLLGITYLSR